MSSPYFEVSVEGADNLVVAQESGADRVELCADVADGGITPSIGTVRAALHVAKVPVCVIVRPRGGDFVYSEVEFESMRQDVLALRELGVAGVVSGCLASDGEVDVPRTAELVKLADGMSFTFHRAFDMVPNLDRALAKLVAIGVHRVLTSGGHATAIEGLETLKRLGELAGGSIVVMPCGSIRAGNVAQVCRHTGLREFHFAAHKAVASMPAGGDTQVSLGIANLGREHTKIVTDPAVVRATVEAGRGAYGT